VCGILGFVSDKPSTKNYTLLGNLLYISSSRGTDATGIAVIGTKSRVVKEDIPADKFIKKHYMGLQKEISKSRVVLGHTRLATQGHQRDNNNNHPIIGPKYIMVHNGTCSSMDRIKNYPYKGTVDSEILLSHVEAKGLSKGLEALKGSAAVAIVGEQEQNTVYLWRHNNPLWVAYDSTEKTVFFGSTEEILREGLANVLNFFSSFSMRQLPEDILYKLTCNPLNIIAIEEIEPIGWGYTAYKNHNKKTDLHPSSGISSYGDNWGDYCAGEGYWDREDISNVPNITTVNPKSEASSTDIKDRDEMSILTGTEDYEILSSVYRAVSACKWDKNTKSFTIDAIKDNPTDTPTRYYFHPASYDFEHWSRLEGGGHVSIDKKVIKLFDHSKKAHFIITVTDAIQEGLIDLNK